MGRREGREGGWEGNGSDWSKWLMRWQWAVSLFFIPSSLPHLSSPPPSIYYYPLPFYLSPPPLHVYTFSSSPLRLLHKFFSKLVFPTIAYFLAFFSSVFRFPLRKLVIKRNVSLMQQTGKIYSLCRIISPRNNCLEFYDWKLKLQVLFFPYKIEEWSGTGIPFNLQFASKRHGLLFP